MSATTTTAGAAAGGARYTVSIAATERAMLWLTGAVSGIVFIEPSPYEFCVILLMGAFALRGLRLTTIHVPLILLLFAYHVGTAITLVPVLDRDNTLMWTLTGIFLGITTVFFASLMTENTSQRLDPLLRGYIVGAVIASLVGILAYFRLMPGGDEFLLYGRARGTFKDPNVFGPFLVLPAVLIIQGFLARRIRAWPMIALLILMVGLLLSGSRGAWGHFIASTLLMTLLTYLVSDSSRGRRRIVLLTGFGALATAIVVVTLISIPQVHSLFLERASLEQSYDVGRLGRFERHWLGFAMALDRPFGIGMLQFTKFFPEDTHNSFLNAFMSGGWLSGLAFPTLVLSTLAIGALALRRRTPWRLPFICIYATYIFVMVESWIIDVDHWRHVQLLLGLVWGLAAATARYRGAGDVQRAASLMPTSMTAR